jgi:hypothetical protein
LYGKARQRATKLSRLVARDGATGEISLDFSVKDFE